MCVASSGIFTTITAIHDIPWLTSKFGMRSGASQKFPTWQILMLLFKLPRILRLLSVEGSLSDACLLIPSLLFIQKIHTELIACVRGHENATWGQIVWNPPTMTLMRVYKSIWGRPQSLRKNKVIPHQRTCGISNATHSAIRHADIFTEGVKILAVNNMALAILESLMKPIKWMFGEYLDQRKPS